MAGTESQSLFQKLRGMISGASASAGTGASCVGLSIGSSCIKLMELKPQGKTWKLLHFGIVQIPDDVIVNREILNPVALVDNLRTLVGQIRLETKNVCISISGTSLIIKRMSVEAPNAKELREQVYWEAEQYVPFDISEVVMDYHQISKGKDNKNDVLLVACKRSIVQSYIGCVEDAGLKVKCVDTDYFALQNIFEANYPQNPSEAVCLVDIGSAATKVVIVQDGVPVFTKDSALGGATLTAEIQKTLSLSFADAETLKVGGQGGQLPQEVVDLMNISVENLSTEIKRSIEFYNASSGGAPVSYILLTGGGSKVPGLSKMVEEQTSIPAQLMNPFNAVAYDASVFTPDYIAAIGPMAAVSLGLAIRAGAPGGKK